MDDSNSNSVSIQLTNSSSSVITLLLEPWAEEIQIPRGKTFTIEGHGDQQGVLCFEHTDAGTIVYGWASSTVTIFDENGVVWDAYAPVPPLPKGASMQSFTKDIFGRKTNPRDVRRKD